MSNLVQELGSGYVRDFFHNSTFMMGDRIYRLVDATDDNITAQYISLTSKEPPVRWNTGVTVPTKDVPDFTAFKHPKLGYRQVDHEKFGKFVIHFTSTRSTQRGFRHETCKMMWLPIYDLFPDWNDGWTSIPHCHQAKHMFVPEFTPFTVGMQKLIAGEWLGFAMSEDVAVGMSVHREENRGFDIYFRGRVVGNVGMDGKANIASSILKRESIKSKLFK